MKGLDIHKFGGTSLGDADRIRHVAALLQRQCEGRPAAVVVSAMGATTDRLVAACDAATSGDRKACAAIVDDVVRAHVGAIDALDIDDDGVREEVEAITSRVADVLDAASRLGELTPRSRARVLSTGERLSSRLVAARLRSLGVAGVAVDADGFVETRGPHLEAVPLRGVVELSIAAALRPLLDAGQVPVVTGFLGRAPDGSTTLLGRGGSDFTATLLAGALDAASVILWTDVDGVYTTDPRIVPAARRIEQLNFREAAELSYYGARVLHQRTMMPVSEKSIPVWVRSSLEPERPGTVVDGRFTPGSHPVKAISAIRDQALVSIEGKGMVGVPGVSARVFGALGARGISVTMISQSSSESSICLAVPRDHALTAEAALKRELRADISQGVIEDVYTRADVGLVAAVGLGMQHVPGIAARVFEALRRRRVNVLAIAQGSSELNISFAVDGEYVERAVQSVHAEFRLDQRDTGRDARDGLDLVLLGCGRIGREFLAQLEDRRSHVRARFGLTPRVVAVADRSGFLFRPAGLDDATLSELIAVKAAGRDIASLPDAISGDGPAELLTAAAEWRLSRPILVDVSDGVEQGPTFIEALRMGWDVVTANKAPLAGPHDQWEDIHLAEAEGGRLLKCEATVGAGLPVIDTLEMLVAAGDVPVRAEGCLSGTLAFITMRLEEGARLSTAVAEARDAGFTEPDAAIDLSGTDVARKAIILARLAGLVADDVDVALEGLVPADWVGLDPDDLGRRLESLDDDIAARIERCRTEGRALRFVARIERGRITVGPTEVDASSPLAGLRGPDNMIVLTTERYADRPLVVSGPGAGVDVTAMAVLSDVMRVAAERSGR